MHKRDHHRAASSSSSSSSSAVTPPAHTKPLVLRLIHPATANESELPTFISMDTLPFSIGRRPNPVKKDHSSIKLNPCDKLLWGMMSRTHAVFSKTKKGLVVEDCDSSHGLYINKQQRYHAVDLSVGDTVSFGMRTLNSREVLGVTYALQYQDAEWDTSGKEAAADGGGDAAASSDRASKRPRIEAEQEEEGVYEEETVVAVRGEELRCGLCLDPIATACHLTCGHNFCFVCTHKFFFHKAIAESRSWGFEAAYQCPADRKPVHSVSRCLRTDEHASALLAGSRRLTADDKEAWEKRRKDGALLAQYYETELQGDPCNLPGTYDKVVLEVKLSERRRARSSCRGCEGPLARDASAFTIQASSCRIEGQHHAHNEAFGTGSGSFFHALCIVPAVVKKMESWRKPERFLSVELRLVYEDDWTEEKKQQAKQKLKEGTWSQDPAHQPWWLHAVEVKSYQHHFIMAMDDIYPPAQAQMRADFLRYITGFQLAVPPLVRDNDVGTESTELNEDEYEDDDDDDEVEDEDFLFDEDDDEVAELLEEDEDEGDDDDDYQTSVLDVFRSDSFLSDEVLEEEDDDDEDDEDEDEDEDDY